MAKAKKMAADVKAESPETLGEPGPIMPGPMPICEVLYVARVAKAETVNTMRRDGRAIFRDAFVEAEVALDVYLTMTGGRKS